MSGARLHPLRGHLQLRRAAVFCLAFMVELAASCWLPMARGDDRSADSQAAAELAARKRILANWQARQDRIKTFYVAWKPGPKDPSAKWAKVGLAGAHRVWVASGGRFREELETVASGQPVVFASQVQAFDGTNFWALWTPRKVVNPDGTLQSLPASQFPEGSVRALRDSADRAFFAFDGAELRTFRPLQSLRGDWSLENSRVTSQNAVVGRQHFVKIQKAPSPSEVVEACWVDPTRDDLVIHFAREYSSGSEYWISFEYKQDPRHGWVPTGWQREIRDTTELGTRGAMRSLAEEAVVTECRINEKFAPGTFQIQFPAGAIVKEIDSQREYFVRRDGSQRAIGHLEREDSLKYQQLVNEDATRPAKP